MRTPSLTLCLARLTVALGAVASSARATVLHVAADTSSTITSFTNVITPAASSKPTLALAANHQVLLGFDLSTLVGSISNVTRARLTFYVTKAITPANLAIHPVTAAWQESGSLSPAPAIDDAVAVVEAPDVGSRRFITIDVTPTVVTWLAGVPNFGFAITTGAGNLVLGAKEGSATGYPATLEIEAAQWVLGPSDLFTHPGQIGIGTTSPLTRLQASVGFGGTDDPAAVFQVENCGGPCDQPEWTEAIRLWNANENGRVGLGFYTHGEGALTNQPQVYLGTEDYYGHNNFRIATLAGGTLTDRLFVNGTTGFVGIGTTLPTAQLQVGSATCNGTTWQNASDRALKKNIHPVDAEAILEKVVALPISHWEYREANAAKHLGPMAQDFHAAFGLNGNDDKRIATVDEGGVALAAIQGLNTKLEKRESRLQAQESVIQSQREEITELKRRLATLEALVTRRQ